MCLPGCYERVQRYKWFHMLAQYRIDCGILEEDLSLKKLQKWRKRMIALKVDYEFNVS